MTSAPLPLLIPGNMCDARLWDGGEGVIRRALGEATGRMPLDADTTQDDTIAAMAARALAATRGPLVAVGFSMGAIVAVEMAVQAPERIAGLVLIGYNATADLPTRAAHRPLQQAEVRAGGLERVLVEELKPNYLAAANRGNIPCSRCCATWGWRSDRRCSSASPRRCACARTEWRRLPASPAPCC